MNRFKQGDRVKVVNDEQYGFTGKGTVGTVPHKKGCGRVELGIKPEELISKTDDVKGLLLADGNYTFWVDAYDLQLIQEANND